KILPTLKDGKGRSFRIGKDLFYKKFEYDIVSGYSAEGIYQKALDHKKELHTEMAKLTKQMWSKYFPTETMPSDSLAAIKMMIDKISLNHAHRDTFQTAIEKQIPVL